MLKKQLTLLLALFALPFAPSNVAASPSGIALRCDNCTPTQMQTRAKSAGVGEPYVFSVPTAVIRLYSVTSQSGGLVAESLTVPAEMTNAAKGLQEIYQTTNGTMRFNATVDARDYGFSNSTAYSMGLSGIDRLMLGDALAQQPMRSLSAHIRALLNLASAFVGLADGVEINVTVEFPDGSTIRYRFVAALNEATYVPHSLRTHDGYPIPEENSAQYSGTYRGDQVIRMADHLRSMGAIVNPNGQSGAGYGSLRCTWNGTTLHCTLQRF